MGISLDSSGSFDNTERWLTKLAKGSLNEILSRYGEMGVAALARATPVRTGRTAASWDYRIVKNANGFQIDWFNTNVQNGSVIALLIQYGHGTGTGGYVQGIDYVNPAIQPVFDAMAEAVVREVSP